MFFLRFIFISAVLSNKVIYILTYTSITVKAENGKNADITYFFAEFAYNKYVIICYN